MSHPNSANRIAHTIRGLETTTRFALAVLSLASGVYTYLGVRSLLDGEANFVFFAAIIYSVAVSVGIYVFWSYLARFFPLMREATTRLLMLGVMLLGSLMIVAMSSWLNAAALAGSAALEQHMAVTLEAYTGDLDAAHANALAAQSLLPDVQLAAERFGTLTTQEQATGAITGSRGAGSVVQLLSQMSTQLDGVAASISASSERATTLFEAGSAHLATMRELVSAPGNVQPRADSFAGEIVQLTGVIAALQETSVAPSVRRAAEDLSLGFIAPVADGISNDLVVRQDQAMANIRAAVDAQSAALVAAAQAIIDQPAVEPRRFVPLSTAEAVLRYAGDFIPAWAGAISIDLVPAVLVLMLAIAHMAMRRDAEGLDGAETMSAAEMMRAVALHERLLETQRRAAATAAAQVDPLDAREEDAPDVAPAPRDAPPAPRPAASDDVLPTEDDTVTPLQLSRKRTDAPGRA